MTPGEAGAYARAVRERVEERPFESQPLLQRTPLIDAAAAAASELGAEGDAQPAELGQPEAASSSPVEPAEASERLAGEQELEAGRVEDVERAEEAEGAEGAEGAEEAEEEVRVPRWGGKSGPA